MKIVDAHSHLWLKQNTTWNGLPIKSKRNGRSIFLGEEVQMIPPFMIDGKNTAEVFLSNMDYAQVSAAVVVQELIDGNQNHYLQQVSEKYPNRFVTCGMVNFFKKTNHPFCPETYIDIFGDLHKLLHRLLIPYQIQTAIGISHCSNSSLVKDSCLIALAIRSLIQRFTTSWGTYLPSATLASAASRTALSSSKVCGIGG